LMKSLSGWTRALQMNLLLRFWCISLFLACASTQAADGLDPIKQETEATYRSWNLVFRPEFSKVASPEVRALISRVQFTVVPYKDFNAYADSRNERIIIPVGLVLMIDAAAGSEATIAVHPECLEHVSDFVGDMLKAYRAESVDNPVVFPNIATYCGLSTTKNFTPEEKHFRDLFIGDFIVGSLSAIVGHELGHLYYRDNANGPVSLAESRVQEARADQFGFDIARKAKLQPYDALGIVFPIFTALEGSEAAAGKGDHPPAFCRILKIAEQMQNDPDIKSLLAGATPSQRQQFQHYMQVQYDNAKKGCPQALRN
jgi:hypothetical protein